MKKIDGVKTVGDVVKEMFAKEESDSEEENWPQLPLSVKLAELEERWTEFAGDAVARVSLPAECANEAGALKITVNVSVPSVLTAVRFRRAAIESKIRAFFGGRNVKIEFRSGSAAKRSKAKPPPPRYKTRVPIKHGEEEIEAEKENFSGAGISEELASQMAKLKLTSEKLAKREKARAKK